MVQSWQRKTKQKVSQKFSQGSTISFPTLTTDNVVVEPLTIEINAAGHDIHRMYIDGGASADILYEHCFQRLRPEVKSQLNPATTSLTGFTGEKIWPMGQLRLPVIVGNKEHSTTAWMNFMVIRSPSPYNGIIGEDQRFLTAIRAVPSTAHGMLKFPVDGGIVTIYNAAAPPKECNTVTRRHVPRVLDRNGRHQAVSRQNKSCHPTSFTAHDERSPVVKWEVRPVLNSIPLSKFSRTSHHLVQTLKKCAKRETSLDYWKQDEEAFTQLKQIIAALSHG
ncbi:reverse transcriptase domain-containing protein [Tanacetum coccineum]